MNIRIHSIRAIPLYGKAYEDWWKNAKQGIMAKGKIIMWCKSTGKRWDKRPGDDKAYCPHHEDKKEAGKDPQIIAVLTLK